MSNATEEILIRLNVDRTGFSTKPTNEQAKAIQIRSAKPEIVEFYELVKLIESGASFRAAAIDGTKEEFWLEQRIFCLDFDNDGKRTTDRISINTAVKMSMAAGIPPAIVYKTFNCNPESQPESQRFRIVYLMDSPVTVFKTAQAIQLYIASIFGDLADPATNTLNQLLYGTNKKCELVQPVFCDSQALAAVSIRTESGQDSTIPSGTKKRTGRTGQAPKRNDIIQAVQNHDAEYIQRTMQCEPQTFETPQEFFNYLFCEMDLSEILGLPTRKAFRCILPSHQTADKTPSASIFQSSSGAWLYHCFSERQTLNIKQLFEIIGAFRSEWQCIEFIKASFNLTVRETKWSQEQKANLDSIIRMMSLTNEEGFSYQCPTAAVNTRYGREIFLSLLTIARSTIFPEAVQDGDIIFYASLKSIASGAGKSVSNLRRVGQHVKSLVYHDMLEIIPDSEVPTKMLRIALRSSRNKENHCQFFRVKSWVYQQLQSIEARGEQWKQYGYTVKGISREMFLRSEGVEIADRLYPQTSHYIDNDGVKHSKQTTKASDRRQAQIESIILELIETQGYCTKAMITEQFTSNIPQYERSLFEICQKYGLRKCRANKELKNLYGIPGNGYPNIIIQDEELQQRI